MSEVTVSHRFPVPAERMWELVGGFNALPQWHPAVERSELEEGGNVRRLRLRGGGEIVERLERMNEDEYAYTCFMVDSPLPVDDYSSTLRLADDGEGGCRVTWSGTFSPQGATNRDAEKAVEELYRAGIENLRRMFSKT